MDIPKNKKQQHPSSSPSLEREESFENKTGEFSRKRVKKEHQTTPETKKINSNREKGAESIKISDKKSVAILERNKYSLEGSLEEKNLSDEIKLSKLFNNFPPAHIWRLFIDGKDQATQGKFGYEKIEPGYLNGCYRGFDHGLKYIRERKVIDSNLLIEIHDRALTDVNQFNPLDSCFHPHELGIRNHEPDFDYSVVCDSAFGNLTQAGVVELQNESIEIESHGNSTLYQHKLYKYKFTIYGKNKERRITLDFGLLSSGKELKRLIDSLLQECYKTINSKNKTSDEKEKAIAVCVTNIQRMHPFRDGNSRTITTMLTNLLRIQSELKPIIWFNPNITDAFSIEEVVKAQKAGEVLFLSYCDTNLTSQSSRPPSASAD